MTKACGRGRPDREERPVEEAGVERDERAIRKLVLEELEVERTWFPSSSGMLVLICLSNATNPAREIWGAFSRSVWLQ